MAEEALKAQIQQLEQERNAAYSDLQAASLQLQKTPFDVNRA